MNQADRAERVLELALRRGDRVAAVNLAQQLWHAGDIRRSAIVGLRSDASRPARDQDGLAVADGMIVGSIEPELGWLCSQRFWRDDRVHRGEMVRCSRRAVPGARKCWQHGGR